MTDGFTTVAILAGGAVGALLRFAIAKAVPDARRATLWTIETGIGVVFGAVLAGAFEVSGRSSGVVSSSAGGALTAFSGACAVYAVMRSKGSSINPLVAGIGHFIASTAATGIGFVVVVALGAPSR